MDERLTHGTVTCPGCDKPMTAIAKEAAANELTTITFRCDACGMETERFIKVEG